MFPLLPILLLFISGAKVCVAKPALICETVPRNLSSLEPKVANALKTLLEAGPGRWVKTGFLPEGIPWERGLSGGAYDTANGSQEFLDLIFGTGEKRSRDITLSQPGKTSPTTKLYANPFAVKGMSPSGGETAKVAPDHRRLPQGAKLEDISEIASFIPESADEYVTWAGHYKRAADELRAAGIQPDPNSRGGKFLAKLDRIWAARDPKVRGSGYEALGGLFWEFTRGPEGP